MEAHLIPFESLQIGLPSQQFDLVSSKIQALRLLNSQLVAVCHIPSDRPQFLKTLDGLDISEVDL